MADPLPETLTRLRAARDAGEKERAWKAFVDRHSKLIHMAARKSTADYDVVMERYTYVLERLREDDFRRLRGFRPGGRSKFTTWLVVVCSRLCVDHQRRRYGRVSRNGAEPEHAETRRRLVDLVGERVDLDGLPDADGHSPDGAVRQRELRRALEAALGALADEERLLLRLRFEDQRKVPDIARMLGLSSEFVAHRRLKGVLTRLREDLMARGVEGSEP